MVDSTDSRRAKLVAEFGEAGADGHSITEARQVPLSRASPPITPIRGSGYSFTPTRRVIDAPDWDFWRHLPDVEIWQACALSLNLEPDKFEWSGDSWLLGPGDHGPSIESTSFRDSDEEASFYKRVKLLCANLFRREHFSAPILNMGKSFKSRAKLPEVAAWAAGIGWSLPDAFPAPAAPDAGKPLATAPDVDATVIPQKSGPSPLTTGDLAFAFSGLWKNESEWKKPLGDKPKWLKDCIAIPGARGVSQTLWNPVNIGAALVLRGHVKANSVRAKFQTVATLKPWREAWKTYEADYLDTE